MTRMLMPPLIEGISWSRNQSWRENRLRSDPANRIRHLMAHRFEETVEARRPRRFRRLRHLVAGFVLRTLAAAFHSAHVVSLPYGGLSVVAALNVGEVWTNAPTKSGSTSKLISSSTRINYGRGLGLRKGELVRPGVAVHALICIICKEPSGL